MCSRRRFASRVKPGTRHSRHSRRPLINFGELAQPQVCQPCPAWNRAEQAQQGEQAQQEGAGRARERAGPKAIGLHTARRQAGCPSLSPPRSFPNQSTAFGPMGPSPCSGEVSKVIGSSSVSRSWQMCSTCEEPEGIACLVKRPKPTASTQFGSVAGVLLATWAATLGNVGGP